MGPSLRRCAARLAGLGAALLLALGPSPASGEGRLSVTFFDVGQGDAQLIVSPEGKTVLIDGGPPESAARLAARVRQLTPGPLDLAVLSHPHLDHLGGLRAVLEAVGARRYLDPGYDHPTVAYRRLLEWVGEQVTEVRVPTPDPARPDEPVTVGLGGGARLLVLWPRAPKEPLLAKTRSDANANSLVLLLEYGQVRVLFTGDAEPDTERVLLRSGRALTAQILKVAHHGGAHSSTRPFLAAVRPRLAVVSCGAANEYGHPSPRTLGRLRSAGAAVLRTDEHGEVRLSTDGATVEVVTERGGEGGGPLKVVLRPERQAQGSPP